MRYTGRKTLLIARLVGITFTLTVVALAGLVIADLLTGGDAVYPLYQKLFVEACNYCIANPSAYDPGTFAWLRCPGITTSLPIATTLITALAIGSWLTLLLSRVVFAAFSFAWRKRTSDDIPLVKEGWRVVLKSLLITAGLTTIVATFMNIAAFSIG